MHFFLAGTEHWAELGLSLETEAKSTYALVISEL